MPTLRVDLHARVVGVTGEPPPTSYFHHSCHIRHMRVQMFAGGAGWLL